MIWYKEWFNEHYLDLYSSRDDQDAKKQIKLLLKKIKIPIGYTILDVGCGLGRHVKIFYDLGYNVTGIDLSSTLIKIGKKQSPNLNLLNQDMKSLIQQGKKFDLVVSLFTSFGYFKSDNDNLKMLKDMFLLLKVGGSLWLDYLNSHFILNQPLKDSITRVKKNNPSLFKYFIEERRINNAENQPRIEKKITLKIKETKKEFKESVRLFTTNELKNMFTSNGFNIQETLGDYDGNIFEISSPRTIIWAKK